MAIMATAGGVVKKAGDAAVSALGKQFQPGKGQGQAPQLLGQVAKLGISAAGDTLMSGNNVGGGKGPLDSRFGPRAQLAAPQMMRPAPQAVGGGQEGPGMLALGSGGAGALGLGAGSQPLGVGPGPNSPQMLPSGPLALPPGPQEPFNQGGEEAKIPGPIYQRAIPTTGREKT